MGILRLAARLPCFYSCLPSCVEEYEVEVCQLESPHVCHRDTVATKEEGLATSQFSGLLTPCEQSGYSFTRAGTTDRVLSEAAGPPLQPSDGEPGRHVPHPHPPSVPHCHRPASRPLHCQANLGSCKYT